MSRWTLLVDGVDVVIVKLEHLTDDRGWLHSRTTFCPGSGRAGN
jgi:hypothetical protein|tara:strand:+ start:5640 stop:5771 length:132 start_codon:yes stop_codon:yes gene_type:complete